MPNAWDLGSARVLESLEFKALATTSSGFAATLGRVDGAVSREEAIAHAAQLAAGVEVPVSADLENGFADDPDGVAETVRMALDAGLAGCSIEDYSGDDDDPIYGLNDATARVAAAVQEGHRGPVHLVISARAENLLRGRDDLDDTIARLQAYEQAGADVLFAPGLRAADDIDRVLQSVSSPVSVLVGPGCPPISELAALGVSRISVGGAFAFAALAALTEAATELRDQGTYGFRERTAAGVGAARAAFMPPREND
jgi:2-methylisocitrate lyase-like PEP mutase family enzyme